MSMPHEAIVRTIADKCQRCYACVRNCPARAIRIHEGRAQVIKERCICCGTCVRVCSQKAKLVRSDTGVVWGFFANRLPVIAVLSSSFPAAFPDIGIGQLVTALRKLGFTDVMEAAFGAELVARAYSDLISQDTRRRFILTCCPAVVDFIEKFYPQLIGLVAPIVSPVVATGRAIKGKYSPLAKVVTIEPCIATKKEVESEAACNVVDAVLTFVELKEMLAFKGIVLSDQEESEFSGPRPNQGRMHGVAGGLLRMAGVDSDTIQNGAILAEGREQVTETLEGVAQGNINARFVELFFCKGCINGPMIGNELSSFRRKELLIDYALRHADPVGANQDTAHYLDLDLACSLVARPVAVGSLNEPDINQVLAQINKQEDKALNCGACGYETCRELSIAILQGLAEKEMCWPYLMEMLEARERKLTEAESRRFYLEHTSRALEEERRHIALELHDTVIQTLVAVLHRLENFLDDKTDSPTRDTRPLWKLREDIRSALQQVRQLSHNLRPAILDDLGLVSALAWLARQQTMQGIETQFRVIGRERHLSPDTQLALFRIAQEALRNVSRHSSASKAEIILDFDANKTTLSVADDGRGFHVPADLAELAQLRKLGLVGIQERARLLGGTMNVKSEVGKGAILTVEVPV